MRQIGALFLFKPILERSVSAARPIVVDYHHIFTGAIRQRQDLSVKTEINVFVVHKFGPGPTTMAANDIVKIGQFLCSIKQTGDSYDFLANKVFSHAAS